MVTNYAKGIVTSNESRKLGFGVQRISVNFGSVID